MLGENLLKYNIGKHKFVVFDFETCNLNLLSADNLPWQASWGVFHGNKEEEQHNYFLRWENLYVSPGAALVTRYNAQEVYNQGKDPKTILEKFESYLYNPEYFLIGHNILNFDVYIHKNLRAKLGIRPDYSYMNRVFDTRILSIAYKTNYKFIEGMDTLEQQYRLLSVKQKGLKTNLAAMCKEMEINFDESKAHDASFDIGRTWELFKALIKRVEI